MTAGRVSPIAPAGSLLKGAGKTVAPRRHASSRIAPPRNAAHLALIRRLGCLSCDADPAGEAAHLRMARDGKPVTGIGIKPDDRYALPLCPACHTDGPGAQHKMGEVAFWRGLGIDALVVCQRLYAASPDVEVMRAVVFAEREKRK